MNSSFLTKHRFDDELTDNYNMFDSRERIEAIIAILSEEINFEYYMKQKVIIAHYPLHKRNPQIISDSFFQFLPKLRYRFVIGDNKWYEHFTAMNFIKSYYGEKYAWEFVFLVHYQAWLYVPAIAGVILFFIQFIIFIKTGDLTEVIDSPYNGIYGIFVSIWSTMFIQSWKKKEKLIRFYWDIKPEDMQKDDERTDDFKFNMVFNELTQQKQKIKLKPNPKKMMMLNGIGRLYLLIVACVLAIYVYLDGFFSTKLESHAEEVKNYPEKYTSYW